MKTEKYLKLIFKDGSLIFRKVKSYSQFNKIQMMTIVFEDNRVVTLDMIYLYTCLGKLENIKDNVTEKLISSTQDLQPTNEVR